MKRLLNPNFLFFFKKVHYPNKQLILQDVITLTKYLID